MPRHPGESPQHNCITREEVSLNDLIEGEADYSGGNEGGQHAAHYLEIKKLTPVENHHRGDGAELDGNLEALLELGLRQAEEFARKDQMAG